MFVFKKPQQVFEFGGIRIGGNPGENPTTLVGGLFFTGQPVVNNTRDGTFDEALAQVWVDTGGEMSSRTGHPLIIQAYGRTPLAMERHLSWLSEHFDGPIMFESTNPAARLRAIEYSQETGLTPRIIYNSINMATKQEELNLLKSTSLDSAVVLGWSPRATSLEDRLETIRSAIRLAESTGIKKMLVDPATMPVGAGFGLEYRMLLAIKSEFGLPTCLAPHNAPSAWNFLREEDLSGEPMHLASVVASTAVAQIMAADCIMYGSMIRTKEVFVAVALIGNAIAASAAEANHALGSDRDLFQPLTFE
jgi:tetrahydromethanopterin S-methyltransferase subunit H